MPRHKEDIEKVNPDFRLNEYISIQKKGWRFQKSGWVVLFILLALSAGGLFGDGFLSSASANSGSMFINYERFYRREAPMKLGFKLDQPAETVISFPVSYLDKVRVESVVPEPDHNETINEMVHYYFNGTGKMAITFYIIPENTGMLEGSIHVNGNVFKLSHLIYP